MWALSEDVNMLERFAVEVAERPLVAIGSGGSSTACHLAALAHRARHGQPALHATPLDILSVPAGLHGAGALLVSASGNNKDVLAAFDACVIEEAPAVAALTLRAHSALSKSASAYDRARVFAAGAPTGKDGYLATNSLLATCVLIARAYGFDVGQPVATISTTDGAAFHGRQMVQILYGGWGAPVASDLESKLSESALAASQLADYRNFGHGRHLWLAKRAAETVVVAIVTPETAPVAESTLRLFPRGIPVVRLQTALEGPAGTIDLLVRAFRLVGQIGEVRDQDPGRPHVPQFGRRLYRLAPPRARRTLPAPIRRKLWASPEACADERPFRKGLARFLKAVQAAPIGAVAIDYDGTLCAVGGRFDRLRRDVIAECSRLLHAGLRIGVATGRGKSVRHELQVALDRSVWPLVSIGYYNGTSIGALGDDTTPGSAGPTDAVLLRALALLESDAWLTTAAKITSRRQQLTVESAGAIRLRALAAHVMARLAALEGEGLRIVVSSHSVDVLGAQPGKRALVSWLQQEIGVRRQVLCIGDRGAWPGNDYSLLAGPLSLSVDDVSSLPDACWNLAPAGVSGPDAALLYLRSLRIRRGVAAFTWKEGSVR